MDIHHYHHVCDEGPAPSTFNMSPIMDAIRESKEQVMSAIDDMIQQEGADNATLLAEVDQIIALVSSTSPGAITAAVNAQMIADGVADDARANTLGVINQATKAEAAKLLAILSPAVVVQPPADPGAVAQAPAPAPPAEGSTAMADDPNAGATEAA